MWNSLDLDGRFWIGVRSTVSGIWQNVDDKTNLTFSNWGSGYPKNDSDLACVIVTGNGFWYNINCDEAPRFICGVPDDEIEIGTSFVIRP